MDHNLQNYFFTLFDADDLVCAGNQYSTTVMSQNDALLSGANFISINPLRDRRLDTNVTKHRNFLIEIDDATLTPEQHLARIKEIEMPISAATWSGGKSVHFIISLETPIDGTTWRIWANTLIQSVPGADPATKNPSRFTRMPNASRLYQDGRQVKQTLLLVTGRICNKSILQFVTDRTLPPKLDKEKFFNDYMDLTGYSAAHPLTKAFIDGTHPCTHGRNNALYKSASNLRDCGFDLDTALEKLLAPALAFGLEHREIIQTLRSAYRHKL